MDSKHRHELERNDLEEFFANFGKWWSKYGTSTLVIVLVVAAGTFGVKFYQQNTAESLDSAWRDLAGTEEAQEVHGFQRLADEQTMPQVKALALLGAGDVLLKESLTLSDPVKQREKLDSTAGHYNDVISGKDYHDVIRFNAMLGLASVAEGRSEWDVAKEQYEQIAKQAAAYDAIVSKAEGRLAMLDQLKKPVTFGPYIPPAPDPIPGLPDGSTPGSFLPGGEGGSFDSLIPDLGNVTDTPKSEGDTPAPDAPSDPPAPEGEK